MWATSSRVAGGAFSGRKIRVYGPDNQHPLPPCRLEPSTHPPSTPYPPCTHHGWMAPATAASHAPLVCILYCKRTPQVVKSPSSSKCSRILSSAFGVSRLFCNEGSLLLLLLRGLTSLIWYFASSQRPSESPPTLTPVCIQCPSVRRANRVGSARHRAMRAFSLRTAAGRDQIPVPRGDASATIAPRST